MSQPVEAPTSMSLADLAGYRPDWCGTIQKDYRGFTLHEIPPNGQGIAALVLLNILARFELAGGASFLTGTGLHAGTDATASSGIWRDLGPALPRAIIAPYPLRSCWHG